MVWQALVEDDLLIYEAFPYHSVMQENRLRIRFRKVRRLQSCNQYYTEILYSVS